MDYLDLPHGCRDGQENADMPSMSAKENVGLLCRWGLLGLTCLTAAVAASTLLTAAASVKEYRAARLVLPDEVWQPGRKAYLAGYLHPRAGRNASNVALCGTRGQPRIFAWGYGSRLHVHSPDSTVGTNYVEVDGLPYGPSSFTRVGAKLIIVPRETAVFLIDARTAIQFLSAQPGNFRDLLASLQRLGQTAFFHPGPLENFVDARRQRGAQLHLHLRPPVLVHDPGPYGLPRARSRRGDQEQRDRNCSTCPHFFCPFSGSGAFGDIT